MNTPSNVAPGVAVDPQRTAPTDLPGTQPLYWSVRRELWENRSVCLAPIAVAAVVLFGTMISTITLPHRLRAAIEPARQLRSVFMPFNAIAGLVIVTAFLVGFFYCLDALHGERRDRSILFWKSLPVSDRTTVLSKAAIPFVVLPLLAIALIVVSQMVLLLLSTAVLLGNTPGPEVLWGRFRFLQMWVAIFYALTVIALWHAPIYAWLLLISGWARRAAFLWVVLPPLAIGVLERIVFRTSHFASLMKYVLIGWYTNGFVLERQGGATFDPLAALAPGRLLGSPGLWVGLILAAVFLALAVRLRRNREPL